MLASTALASLCWLVRSCCGGLVVLRRPGRQLLFLSLSPPGCPYSKDPKSTHAGTGGPPDGTYKNLKTGDTCTRSNGGNIKDEIAAKFSNEPGTLSMANTGQPNSGGSQFFMNVVHNDFLDWFSPGESKHPVFGKCVDKASLDIMVKISKVPTRDDCPVTPVMMKSVTIAGI